MQRYNNKLSWYEKWFHFSLITPFIQQIRTWEMRHWRAIYAYILLRTLAFWLCGVAYLPCDVQTYYMARRHIMLFTFSFLFMAFLSTLCTFAHNTMIFNMLYGVYTKSFHIHSCLHLSADKAYSLVPGRRNSIGGEKILLVRHFLLSPYTEMTRSQCKQLHIVVQTVLTPTFRVQTSADNIAEVHTKINITYTP